MSVEEIILPKKRFTGYRYEFSAMCFEVAKVVFAIVFADALLQSFGSIEIAGISNSVAGRWIATVIGFALSVFFMFVYLHRNRL